MKRLILAAVTFLGACKGSDFAIAEGLNDAESAEVVAECGLDPDDYQLDSGTLVLSCDVPFEKVQCVIKRVRALGKFSGPEVGNEKYVTEPNS